MVYEKWILYKLLEISFILYIIHMEVLIQFQLTSGQFLAALLSLVDQIFVSGEVGEECSLL